MELLDIYKDICEQKTLLISSCFALKGHLMHPNVIEKVLSGNKLSEFTYEQVISIFIYNSILDFIDECEKQDYSELNGALALALSNYLMRDISVRESFINTAYTPDDVCSELDAVFSLRQKEQSLSSFIKIMYSKLTSLELFKYDNYIFMYFLIVFYFYIERKQVPVCTYSSEKREENIYDLTSFVLSLEG